MDNTVIVIDDEQDFLDSVKRVLITSGIKTVRTESNAGKAASEFEKGEAFDIALIDINMPDMDGFELLQVIKNTSPTTECIMLTALDDARAAVKCLKTGAYDYLVKPVSGENMLLSINRAMERKRLMEIKDLSKRKTHLKIKNPEAFKAIVTQSSEMLRILNEAELHALSDIPILITGETGTGKELLSQSIHAASPRAKFDFIAINMESLNPQLFESQFFGHTKGAFTGAETGQVGYLESNHRGTLFLDEIGNLPLDLQGKLLRVLQEGEFIKIGSSKAQKVNIRFIAATNADLERMVEQKRFRKDLYYRLKGGWLHLPPLRERKDDILLLINHFIIEFCGPDGINIEEEVLSTLREYDYPGNIRELKSILQAAVNLAQGKTIALKHLPKEILMRGQFASKNQDSQTEPIQTLHQIEKKYILKVYKKFGENKSQTARALGIALNTLKSKLETYDVENLSAKAPTEKK
jgi:two-component system response regulator AtoC